MSYRDNVCPREAMSKDKLQHLLAEAWGRVWPKLGGMTIMAKRMGLNDTKTIQRVTGICNLPEAHTIFNSLLADPTALNEVLGYYGYKLCPLESTAANDYATLAGVCEIGGRFAVALEDGHRDHRETLAIADAIAPHLPALSAIVQEAQELRRARA
jgi:hypothetical protein